MKAKEKLWEGRTAMRLFIKDGFEAYRARAEYRQWMLHDDLMILREEEEMFFLHEWQKPYLQRIYRCVKSATEKSFRRGWNRYRDTYKKLQFDLKEVVFYHSFEHDSRDTSFVKNDDFKDANNFFRMEMLNSPFFFRDVLNMIADPRVEIDVRISLHTHCRLWFQQAPLFLAPSETNQDRFQNDVDDVKTILQDALDGTTTNQYAFIRLTNLLSDIRYGPIKFFDILRELNRPHTQDQHGLMQEYAEMPMLPDILESDEQIIDDFGWQDQTTSGSNTMMAFHFCHLRNLPKKQDELADWNTLFDEFFKIWVHHSGLQITAAGMRYAIGALLDEKDVRALYVQLRGDPAEFDVEECERMGAIIVNRLHELFGGNHKFLCIFRVLLYSVTLPTACTSPSFRLVEDTETVWGVNADMRPSGESSDESSGEESVEEEGLPLGDSSSDASGGSPMSVSARAR